jgi:murein L,D-transpeptidase YcbB/YkuD
MNEATPKRFKYKKLEKKLVQYLDLAQRGGWKMLPKYKRVKPNRRSSIVPKIRKRLKLEDEAKKCATPNDENLYDKCLQKAVFRYKIRHGIKADKYIDNSLRKALNIPIHKKIAMMRLNLDRIKWLYRDEEPLRIELNIPSFRLNLYDRNKIITTIRAVVGRADHPTPIFHNVMKYVVVNPYWKIPESIVKHEMLRHLIKDPYYYDRRGKVLKKSWDENSKDVDPGKVNWKKYYRKRNDENMHIPYYFMQLPGSRNALGKIKFLFPNKYSVYIHDTPSKRLFFRTDRAFSHGCMRIQKPKELLKMLALYNENINVDKIMRKLGTTKKETISLEKTVPVDITYLTSYVDDYNNLHFRKDIYKYDKYQLENYKYPDLIGKIKKVLPKKKTQKKSQKPTPQNSNPHKKTNSQKRASTPAQNSPTTTKKPRAKEQAPKPTPTPAPTQMPKDITPVTAGDSGDLF